MTGRLSELAAVAVAALGILGSPARARAESGQVFGIAFFDWGSNVDVMSHRTGWLVETNVTEEEDGTETGPNASGRQMPAASQGYTLIQRLDWKWSQTIPLTSAEQDKFARQCKENWVRKIKKYCRYYLIGNEVEYFSVTPDIYAACYVKVRAKILEEQPDARILIGHHNSNGNVRQVIQLLKSPLYNCPYDGVTAHTGSSVPDDLCQILDDEGAPAGVGVHITEWGWVAGTNEYAWDVMQSFASALGQWNATHSRQVYSACWFVYPDGIGWNTFSLELSPLDNAAFENATALNQALNAYASNPVIMTSLLVDVPDAGTSLTVSWNTQVQARTQIWWTPAGTSGAGFEQPGDLDTTLTYAHSRTISNLVPASAYEVMPTSTRDGYGDAGGRRFLAKTGPWTSQARQVAAPTRTAEITWSTDWPADGRVEYGQTQSLGSAVSDANLVTDHVFRISGLSTGRYYYRILSSEENPDLNGARCSMRSPIRVFDVFAKAPGDFDGDGDIDPDDLAAFAACFSGPKEAPGYQPPSLQCVNSFDWNADGDVDCDDWAWFVLDWTGPPVCPPPFSPCVPEDCNSNGALDSCEIEQGWSTDCDANLVPDECQPDGDADAVIDACDDCPGTIPGATVDENGCPLLVAADFDEDGDVDQTDFAHLQACLAGSGITPASGCTDADLEGDNDVDPSDFARFQRCLSGPHVAADPACESG